MSVDPCKAVNNSVNKASKPVNIAWRAVCTGLNVVIDAMNDFNGSFIDLINKFPQAISFILTEPMKSINSLTDQLKDLISAIFEIPYNSILGIAQIMLLPFIYNIKQTIDSALPFLPNIPVELVLFVLALVAFFVVFGNLIGAMFMSVALSYNSVAFIVNNFIQPVTGLATGGSGWLALTLGWLVFGLICYLLFTTVLRVPVPCYCEGAPESPFLVCQAGSQEGSDNCKMIKEQNAKMLAASQRVSAALIKLGKKVDKLLPDLPISGLPDIPAPEKIPRVPVTDLIPKSKIPSCGFNVNNEINKAGDAVKDLGKKAKKKSKKAGKDIANFFGF